jgi:hypothetical protein
MKCINGIIAGLTLSILPATLPAQTEPPTSSTSRPYCVVDTGQTHCFSDKGQLLNVPKPNEPFFGQDALTKNRMPRGQR